MSYMVKDKSFYSTLISLSVPMALQSLITFGIGFADNIMISALGDHAISGVFVSNQAQNILHMLTIGIGGAMTILVSQYLGKKDTKNAKTIISIALKLSLILGLLCTVLALFLPKQILSLFTKDISVIEEGMKYIGIVCFSYVFFCINNVFIAALRCAGNTRIGFLNSLAGFCINVFLNWILIFGKLGMPALGVRGAAIATLTARIIEMLISGCYLRFFDTELLFRYKDILHNNILLLKDFFQYGLPIILADVLWGIGGAVQVAILGRFGAEVIAASTVAGNLHQIFGVVVYAFAGASGIIIGRTVGAGEYNTVKAYSRTLEIIFLSTGILTGLATFLCKDIILSTVFKGISPEAHAYALQFLTVLSVTIVGTSYQMSVLTGIVRPGGATSFVLINDIIFVWGVTVPLALLATFVFHLSPVIVFACLKCDQILKCIVAVIKLRRYDWMKKLTRTDDLLVSQD